MKSTRHPIFCFVISMLLWGTVFAIPIAADTYDTDITSFATSYFAYKLLDTARDKDDSSAMYLYITSSNQTYTFVRALGTNSTSPTQFNTTNLTYANGARVANVTCSRYTRYSIHNLIYENGYSYATYSFECPFIAGDHISGLWSPDTEGQYVDAQ